MMLGWQCVRKQVGFNYALFVFPPSIFFSTEGSLWDESQHNFDLEQFFPMYSFHSM